VAKVKDEGVTVNTWDGLYELALCISGELELRIMELILVCEDWHERLEQNPASPPALAELDQYNDIIYSDLWQIQSSDGITCSRLDGAPVFHRGVLSWKCSRKRKGKPIRTPNIGPTWQTATVLALAQAAYDNRILPAGTLEPARLAILADALEEAGCD